MTYDRPTVSPEAASRHPLSPADLLDVLLTSLTVPETGALDLLDAGADVTARTWEELGVLSADAGLRVRVREPGKPTRTFDLRCVEVPE